MQYKRDHFILLSLYLVLVPLNTITCSSVCEHRGVVSLEYVLHEVPGSLVVQLLLGRVRTKRLNNRLMDCNSVVRVHIIPSKKNSGGVLIWRNSFYGIQNSDGFQLIFSSNQPQLRWKSQLNSARIFFVNQAGIQPEFSPEFRWNVNKFPPDFHCTKFRWKPYHRVSSSKTRYLVEDENTYREKNNLFVFFCREA